MVWEKPAAFVVFPSVVRQKGGKLVGLALSVKPSYQVTHRVEVHAELFGDVWEGTLIHEVSAEDLIVFV